MSGIQKINGRRPASADFTFSIIGSQMAAGTAAFHSLKATDKVAKKGAYGNGRSGKPNGWSKGNWEGTFEVTWYLDEWLDIQTMLEQRAAAIQGGIDDVEFDIIGSWKFPGDLRLRTLKAESLSLLERTVEVDKTSEDSNMITVPLFIWKPVELNGVAFTK